MTKTILALSVFVTFLPAVALGRPVDLKDLRLDSQIAPVPRGSENRTGVFTTASQGTTYFGGTVWNPDSMRWEAMVGGTWTFDSGVGSFIIEEDPNNPGHPKRYPHVNPYKQIGLHGTMEGWTGIDHTYHDAGYFRRLSDQDPAWGTYTPCVGASGGLGGNYSFWAGVLPPEADELCYATGCGYGDRWNICVAQDFEYTGGPVTFEYSYLNDTEAGFDFTYVIIDTTGQGDEVTLATYTGTVSGTETMTLVPGSGFLPSEPGPATIQFCVYTDHGYSDQDGYYPSTCGAFAVDDISLSGGIVHTADFETGNDGWALLPTRPGPGGEWSNIVSYTDLPNPQTDCACGIQDSVLVFEDLTVGGHGPLQWNTAMSPWIDLRAAGAATPGKFIEFTGYFNLPVANYIFMTVRAQWYPGVCQRTGKLITSRISIPTSTWYLFHGRPTCPDPSYVIDIGYSLPPGAEQVRIGFTVLNFCRFGYPCTGLSNTTPWIDNVRFGAYGNPDAPLIVGSMPKDAFPENGSLLMDAPGRFDDVFLNSYDEGPYSSLGDTLYVVGSADNAEVHVQFEIFPGPGINTSRLDQFYSKFHPEGDGWYSARMDTAERGGILLFDSYMTAFHETEPAFTGSDTDLDPNDLDPYGNMSRLANDMFPDDLFTPGTRIHLFYKARFVGGSTWFTFPDTTGLHRRPVPDPPSKEDGKPFFEWECLPSSMSPGGDWNCILYVDYSGGGQPVLEAGLDAVLGPGSANYEDRLWDRFDLVTAEPKGYFGRPLHTEYGATVTQALGYRTIVWEAGNTRIINLSRMDSDVLIPWLTLDEVGDNNLYLTGSSLASSVVQGGAMQPSTRQLLEDLCGVRLVCDTFREQDCPQGTNKDATPCPDINPVPGANVADALARSSSHQAFSSGCPNLLNYDVLEVHPNPLYGVARGDEEYVGTLKIAQYASITNDASENGPLTYKTVVDGVSVSSRRDPGACVEYPASDPVAVEERLREVLTWFGALSGSTCVDRTIGVSIPKPIREPTYQTALMPFAPNPLMGGTTGKIRFTMAEEAHATVEVFDLNGRLVRRVFDGLAQEGPNEAAWSGIDETGRLVASGVYFVRLKTPDRTLKTKMVLIAANPR